jgi:transposase
MLGLAYNTRVFLAVAPVDMRKQMDGLWALAEQVLAEDPASGSLFVFSNRNRNHLKILYWDGTGIWLLAKRLEKGRFNWPRHQCAGKLVLLPEELTLLLHGIDLKNCRKKSWYGR